MSFDVGLSFPFTTLSRRRISHGVQTVGLRLPYIDITIYLYFVAILALSVSLPTFYWSIIRLCSAHSALLLDLPIRLPCVSLYYPSLSFD